MLHYRIMVFISFIVIALNIYTTIITEGCGKWVYTMIYCTQDKC